MNAAGHEFRPHIKAIRRSWFGMGIAGVTLRSLSMAAFRRRYSDVAVGLKLLDPVIIYELTCLLLLLSRRV
jgi:hypothetical protein